MNIFGVRIDNLSKNEILKKTESFLNEGGFHQIATINPEFILHAQQDEKFKKILNKCSLNVADGIGLKYAFLRYGYWLKVRIAGADLMCNILDMAYRRGDSVYFAVNNSGLSTYKDISEIIGKIYPGLKIDGLDIDPDGSFENIIPVAAVLLCNFGAPRQEYFIDSVKNDTIKLAMGVGGSFDFVTGKVRRAPKFMRHVGLEWAYRLIQQPADKDFRTKRIKRIFNAVFIFPIKVLMSKKNFLSKT